MFLDLSMTVTVAMRHYTILVAVAVIDVGDRNATAKVGD